MKKIIKFIMCALIILPCIMMLSACGDTNNPPATSYTITFEANGGSSVSSINGTEIQTEPATTKASYAFAGWFESESLTGNKITFPYTITADKTFYAKWNVQYSSGLSYKLLDGDASYEVQGGSCTDTNVVIPSTYNNKPVTSIGVMAFKNCNSLTSITIPNSVTDIGYFAFFGCGSLTNITIPSSVTRIGESTFGNCRSLTSITIPSSVTSIGDSAFWNCNSLTSITIPSSVTSIGYFAFENCSSLTSITIPNSVTRIGESTFWNCISLTNITIPSSVTSIGVMAFKNCNSLTSITIPNSVTDIGNAAFGFCGNLTIYCGASSKPTNWDARWNYSNRPVYWFSEEQPTEQGNYWHYVDVDGVQTPTKWNV